MNMHKEEHRIAKQSLTEALFLLLNEKPLSEITITELVEKSGVARATYYRNYQSKEDIIFTFVGEKLSELFRDYPINRVEDLFSKEHVSIMQSFFATYRPFLEVLNKNNMSSMTINFANNYMVEKFGKDNLSSRELFLLYAFVGAEHNVIFNLMLADEAIPKDEITLRIMDLFTKD
ncbi:MAG: TetR/AcrR family transcriptional regulator [bacterium]